MEGHSLYKIGRTSNVPRRMSEIGIQLPFPYELCFAHRVPNMYYEESDLHETFKDFRKNGEWFDLPASAVSYIETCLLIIQAYDLVDRVVTTIGESSNRGPVELEKYGRILIDLARRTNRRLLNRHLAAKAFQEDWRVLEFLAEGTIQ